MKFKALVFVAFPIEEGLKLGHNLPVFVLQKQVFVAFPIEEGLKRNLSRIALFWFWVFVAFPIEEGLKHVTFAR